MGNKRTAVEGDYLVEYEEVVSARHSIKEKQELLTQLQEQQRAFEERFDLRGLAQLRHDLMLAADEDFEEEMRRWFSSRDRRDEYERIRKQIGELETWLADVNTEKEKKKP